jgi:hypothetical protein
MSTKFSKAGFAKEFNARAMFFAHGGLVIMLIGMSGSSRMSGSYGRLGKLFDFLGNFSSGRDSFRTASRFNRLSR